MVRNVLVVATIPLGLTACATWAAFIAFELFPLAASLF